MSTTKPRFVFDTNTLISAVLFTESTPGRALRQALETGVLLASPDTLIELAGVLGRARFDPYLTLEEREEFLTALVARVEIVDPVEEVRVCRDPDDDKFLALAVAGGAEALISGDRDLLALHPFRGIPIVSAAELLDR